MRLPIKLRDKLYLDWLNYIISIVVGNRALTFFGRLDTGIGPRFYSDYFTIKAKIEYLRRYLPCTCLLATIVLRAR